MSLSPMRLFASRPACLGCPDWHAGPCRPEPRVEILEGRLLPSNFPVTNTLDAGDGSLRNALTGADGNPGLDTITFNVGGGGVQIIAPASALPPVTDPVVIDGTTQP